MLSHSMSCGSFRYATEPCGGISSLQLLLGALSVLWQQHTMDTPPWTTLFCSPGLSATSYYIFTRSTSVIRSQALTKIESTSLTDSSQLSGLLSMQEAKYRWYITTVMYVVAGIAIGNIWSSLLWVFLTLMLCFGGWDKHWFSKNCIATRASRSTCTPRKH